MIVKTPEGFDDWSDEQKAEYVETEKAIYRKFINRLSSEIAKEIDNAILHGIG